MRDILMPMAQRPKFQIDASPEVINQVKIAAYKQGYPSLRAFILSAIAQKAPELRKLIDDELR